jgi:HAD superfamily phosphatase (TIGR01668 family)
VRLEFWQPHRRVKSIVDVDLDELRAEGHRAIMLDVDNTLLPYRSQDPPRSARDWIGRARQADMQICLVSNTRRIARIRSIALELDVPFLARAGKPRKSAYRKAAAILGVDPEHAVVIGDQVMRDIWGGRAAGMLTILVDPIDDNEFLLTRLERLIERFVLRGLGIMVARQDRSP